MDANNLDMIVTNHGSFAFDLLTGNAGLIYPKGSTRTVVFASGAWMGARVGPFSEVRIAAGEYAQEFVPGPMANGSFLPDETAFKSYKIVRGNTTDPDYLNWPVNQGAPVDRDGKPLLLGDATIWSVYNDADPSVHFVYATAPLGIEIQQTTFAFNRAGPLGNIIFVLFKIINKSAEAFRGTYFSLWSDPDLGGYSDDLVGCDTTLSMGYCYNATNSDAMYGTQPPAVGYSLLRGPAVPVSPGVYDTLGMSSFIKYINGTDPSTPAEVYNYMRGLSRDGEPIHVDDDPALPVTTYQVSGDPVTGSGWLDSTPADRRLAITTGPFDMEPGQTHQIAVAILVGQGTDRLSSITALRNMAPIARLVYQQLFPQVTKLDVALNLDPDVINLKNHAPWVTAYLEPSGFDVSTIDFTSLRLAGSVPPVPKVAVVGDRNGNGIPELMAKFGRPALDPLLTLGANELEVTGRLMTGEEFRGSDRVRVIDPSQAHPVVMAPNPLNPGGTLTFQNPGLGRVSVKMYDLQGGLVRTLAEIPLLPAGEHQLRFDGRGDKGKALASGVYFYRVETSGGIATGRVVVLK
jgi:hypothetical protein